MTAAVDADALAVAVAGLIPEPGHANLLAAARAATGLDLGLVVVDDGWFRLGGVMDRSGRRLADDLEEWVQGETDGDLTELYERHAGDGLRFTRHSGRRIYLTAPTGPGPLDFVQVEVDRVQEMLCRPLFENGPPDSLLDLETLPAWPEAVPLSAARYVCRRVTNPRDLLEGGKSDPRLARFASEWQATSAGASSPLCRRWALGVQPYRDEDGNHVLEARPLTAARPTLPDLQEARAHAADYHPARMVRAVDEAAGFPMAWYFLQVARHYAHFSCMVDIRDDFAKGAAGPLSSADAQVIDGWIDTPYSFH